MFDYKPVTKKGRPTRAGPDAINQIKAEGISLPRTR